MLNQNNFSDISTKPNSNKTITTIIGVIITLLVLMLASCGYAVLID